MFDSKPFFSRREMIKLAGAGILGGSATGWFDVLAARAAESTPAGRKHKSCILLFMSGGPSQMDTFDLKPGSPNAGEFKPAATPVSGLKISEHLPKLAKAAGDLAVLRSMSTSEGAHARARFYVHTGYREGVGGVVHPSLGAVASAQIGDPEAELPNFVAVGGGAYGSGFLGARHAPLLVSDAARGVENLKAADSLSELDKRASLLTELEDGFLNRVGDPSIAAHKTTYQKALSLMHSVKSKAFDIALEPASIREAYGSGRFSEACLLARRLVESGVAFVEINLGGWDTHQNNWARVKTLSAQVDAGMSALIADLKSRGLLDSTMVIWMGEFGRTPKINSRGAQPGRDHYPRAWTTVLAGGGLKTGKVIGETDKDGTAVKERPVSAIDFLASVCKGLGIDYTKQQNTREGRPIRIVDKGEKLVTELFS
jgi:uncharacterized protein (DUF1501 family)